MNYYCKVENWTFSMGYARVSKLLDNCRNVNTCGRKCNKVKYMTGQPSSDCWILCFRPQEFAVLLWALTTRLTWHSTAERSFRESALRTLKIHYESTMKRNRPSGLTWTYAYPWGWWAFECLTCWMVCEKGDQTGSVYTLHNEPFLSLHYRDGSLGFDKGREKLW